jgi:ATP-dependent Clp protease adapter protein ClpS
MAELILYKSDDLNVEYMTACIIKFCDYNAIKAEQIATIIHFRGSCIAMIREYEELDEIAFLFDSVGVKTKIEV